MSTFATTFEQGDPPDDMDTGWRVDGAGCLLGRAYRIDINSGSTLGPAAMLSPADAFKLALDILDWHRRHVHVVNRIFKVRYRVWEDPRSRDWVIRAVDERAAVQKTEDMIRRAGWTPRSISPALPG